VKASLVGANSVFFEELSKVSRIEGLAAVTAAISVVKFLLKYAGSTTVLTNVL
jgi:hypothetical protein